MPTLSSFMLSLRPYFALAGALLPCASVSTARAMRFSSLMLASTAASSLALKSGCRKSISTARKPL